MQKRKKKKVIRTAVLAHLEARKTFHMTSPLNSSKSQSLRTPRHTRSLPIYNPLFQSLLSKVLLPTPLQRQSPLLVPYEVADPVVRAHVDKRFDSAFKEGSDIMVGGAIFVQVLPEGLTYL